MEDTATESSTPTLQRKSSSSSRKSHTGVKKTTTTRFRRPSRDSHGYWGRRRRSSKCTKRANTNMQQNAIEENGECSSTEKEEEDEKEEKAEVERKMKALQSLVPGGESFGVDELFEETAGYIMALQYQVKTMRALTSYFHKLEKENTKFGG